MSDTQNKQKIERTPLYTLCRVVFAFLFHTFCPARFFNTEVLDRADAPYIIIGNHKSGVDPFALAYITRRF